MESSPIHRPSEPGCLIVTGMHHSGASTLGALLQSAGGVDLGASRLPAEGAQRPGPCRDPELLELQREMLLACTIAESGWRDWGWTESQRLDFSRLPSFRTEAEALLRKRQAGGRAWGWADPRTTILLDFWNDLLPAARYVFVYRAPWEVAAAVAALRRPPFLEHPDFVPRIWSFYNRQILDFYRRHRDRCLLLEAGALLARPEEALALVRAQLGFPLRQPLDGTAALPVARGAVGADGSSGAPDVLAAASPWRLAARIYPLEARLWAELEQAGDLAAGREVPAEPAASSDPRPAAQDPPTFTVVIPCFNQGEFVLAAVASVEQSEGVAFELIVVNDGSGDRFTIEILERLRALGYRVLDQPNRGVAAARNAAIRAARGRYVLPLDADNRIHSCYLRRAAETLDAASDVGVVYGDADLSGERNGLWRMPEFDLDEMATGNRIDACGAFRRALWEQCGGYDEDAALGWEDWDFWLSAAEQGWRFVHLPEVMFEYRTHSASMSGSGARQQDRRAMLEFVMAKHPAIYQPRLPAMFAEKDDHWQQAEARAARLERSLEELRGNFETARGAQEEARRELERASGELRSAQAELQAARSDLGRWQERVEFMSGTRAWKLRARLLRWRAALGPRR